MKINQFTFANLLILGAALINFAYADHEELMESTPDPEPGPGPKVGLIVGICIGLLVLIIGAFVAFKIFKQKSGKAEESKEPEMSEIPLPTAEATI